jgi:Protein of unknown function (DUF1549)/Protein of unknown function (DUF1553)/Planctomycete cytochrome C
MRFRLVFALLFGALVRPAVGAEVVDFSHDITPILRRRCIECHSEEKKKGGLSLNTREAMLRGGENGAVVRPGDSAHSPLLARVLSRDADEQMPPKGDRLTDDEVAKLRAWIDAGAPWTEGFAFKKPAYDPPLKPRRPVLPAARGGRTNLIDRILDEQLARDHQARPAPLGDAAFARRVHLDLIGLPPSTEALDAFLADRHPDKRARLVERLLTNDVAYAEHWLSFWNDLLRNDYAGTGYIDDGRRQISSWLYRALLENKRYDQFVRELIAPTTESEGFTYGIKWRGAVSAGQTTPVQFAQSLGQSFLGINLKCASCHDSFIDRWTLAESYGLAAIYSDTPLEIFRCDKPTGRMAKPGWLFPELGGIDASKPKAERLKEVAALLTHPDNGRFTRTLVNRLWHRLMGRGIVHPVDAMQTAPWNSDLLDALASDFADHGYNLKWTLALICDSAAYQSRAEVKKPGQDDHGYHYAGPRAKRVTAEQFVDALWQLTGTAPERYDAPVVRAHVDPNLKADAKWIWSPGAVPPPAGDTATFKTTFVLSEAPAAASAILTADNSYTLFVNGRKLKSGDNWEAVDTVDVLPALQTGENTIVITAKNGGDAPNPAGLVCEVVWRTKNGRVRTLGTGAEWSCLHSGADDHGIVKGSDWTPAVVLDDAGWRDKVSPKLRAALTVALAPEHPMVRASLLKSDMLQRTLGRPNREQIVSMRPDELSTLEAMDLSNGPVLAGILADGAKKLTARGWRSPDAFVEWLYRASLSRPPTRRELATARDALGPKLTPEGVEDVLWSVLLLPEFQFIR